MEKDKFIEKMFQLGVELEKANDAFHCSMIINDAQILYKQQFEAKNNESLHDVVNCKHDWIETQYGSTGIMFKCVKCGETR